MTPDPGKPFPRAGYCETCGRYCLDATWCVRCYLFGGARK